MLTVIHSKMIVRRSALTALCALLLSACGGTPESREAAHMKKGREAFEKQEYRKAVIEFKVASQNMPTHAEPLYRLGLTYQKVGAVPLAFQSFQKAQTVDPTHEGARFQVAMFKVGSDKPENLDEARPVLREHLATHPADTEAMGALALAEAKSGNKDEALRYLVAAAEKDPANPRPAMVVIAWYAAKNDPAAATAITHALTASQPRSPELASLRAEVALSTHDAADANAEIARALTLSRSSRTALQLRLRQELADGNTLGAEKSAKALSELPEKQLWSAWARMLFAEGKIDEGIAEFKRVLKEHPAGDSRDAADLPNQFSSLLLTAGRRTEAAAVIAATLAGQPKDKTALLQRASLAIDNGDLDAGSRDIKTLQEMKVFSAPVTYQQSRIFAARGDLRRRGELLTDTLKLDPRLFAARLDLAQLFLAAGNAKQALETLSQASPLEQGSVEFAYVRNIALTEAGDYPAARKSIDAALAKARNSGFLYTDALLRTRTKDLPGARKSLEAAFALTPSHPAILSLLGDVMTKSGELPRFQTMVQEAAAKNPAAAELQTTLGRILATQGNQAGARAAFTAARNFPDAIVGLARLDIATGGLDAARQRLLDLTKTRDTAATRALLAEVETRKGSPPEAITSHYLRALELEPSNSQVMNDLAETLASRQNKLDDARFWAEKALALDPQNPFTTDTVGWIYFRQGKADAALPFLERSLKAMDRPTAHYHLAAALAATGDKIRARKEYDLALKQDPKSPARVEVSRLFGQ